MNTPENFSIENLQFDQAAIAAVAADFRDRPNYGPQDVLRDMRQNSGVLSVIAHELSQTPHDTPEQAAAEDEDKKAGVKEQLGMIFGYAVMLGAADNPLPSLNLPALRGYTKVASKRPDLLETHFRGDYGKHDDVLKLVSEESPYLRNNFSRYGAKLLFACFGLVKHPERGPKVIEPAWSDSHTPSRATGQRTPQDRVGQRSNSRRLAALGVPGTIRA